MIVFYNYVQNISVGVILASILNAPLILFAQQSYLQCESGIQNCMPNGRTAFLSKYRRHYWTAPPVFLFLSLLYSVSICSISLRSEFKFCHRLNFTFQPFGINE